MYYRCCGMVFASARFSTRLSPAPGLNKFVRNYGNTSTGLDPTSDLFLQQLNQRHYVYEDRLSSQPATLLRAALKTYLPPEEAGLNYSETADWLPLGFQHAYFRPHLSFVDLCEDGTDIKFLPGPEDVWKYRLWAGGSVAYHSSKPLSFHVQPSMTLLEHASNTRVVNDHGKASKVFVTIKRQFLVTPSVHTTNELISSLLDANRDGHTPESVSLTETENICFLRDPPISLQDERRIKPPSSPTVTHTLIPTRSLLFQFSALTYNAHSIHVDREFAQKVYLAKDLVVHGPLTQVLMLEFLRRSLQRFYRSYSASPMLKSVNYSNLQPLYVDQPLILCCQPVSKFMDAHPIEVKAWNVWIQKGEGENASLAVKATVNVDSMPHANS